MAAAGRRSAPTTPGWAAKCGVPGATPHRQRTAGGEGVEGRRPSPTGYHPTPHPPAAACPPPPQRPGGSCPQAAPPPGRPPPWGRAPAQPPAGWRGPLSWEAGTARAAAQTAAAGAGRPPRWRRHWRRPPRRQLRPLPGGGMGRPPQTAAHCLLASCLAPLPCAPDTAGGRGGGEERVTKHECTEQGNAIPPSRFRACRQHWHPSSRRPTCAAMRSSICWCCAGRVLRLVTSVASCTAWAEGEWECGAG